MMARRENMSNPLDPEVMSAAERLEEAAALLARGILRRRLRTADGRKKPLDVLREARDECVEPQSEGRDT
jgi:hypothetical protein